MRLRAQQGHHDTQGRSMEQRDGEAGGNAESADSGNLFNMPTQHAEGEFRGGGRPNLRPGVHQQIKRRVIQPKLNVLVPTEAERLDGVAFRLLLPLMREIEGKAVLGQCVHQTLFIVEQPIQHRRLHTGTFRDGPRGERIPSALLEQFQGSGQDACPRLFASAGGLSLMVMLFFLHRHSLRVDLPLCYQWERYKLSMETPLALFGGNVIVVTGATGKLGKLIVEELASRMPRGEMGVSVRDLEKAAGLRERGIRVRQGDFAQPDALGDAFEGASQLLMVSSNARAFGGDPLAQHRAAIAAAKQAGVKRIVYTSQIASSDLSAFPPALDHAATETMLANSGLAWTALRNGFYADAAPMFMGPEWQKGKIAAPADGKVAWTTHRDLAAAAAAILTGVETFDGPTPPLTGMDALDLADLASLGSALTGSPIAREVVSDDAFREMARARGLPEGVARITLGYYEASRRGEFGKVDPTLERLIGRRPETMEGVLQAAMSQGR